jgi:ribosomal protein S2
MTIYIKTKLTFLQMMHIGMHIGHTLKTSKFLTFWIYASWRNDIFIINLVRTNYVLRMCLDSVFQNAYRMGTF